ncbi:hypothetical protein D3C75_707440 [compost metagenome]
MNDVPVVDLRNNFQLGTDGFTLHRVKDVITAGGLGTGQHRHVLTDIERRLFVIQRHHARGRENVVFTIGGKGGHQRAKITVKEAGRHTGKVGPFNDAVLNLTNRHAGGAKLYAAMFAGPLHAKVEAVAVLHFGNDRLHQYLRTTDIELVDHFFQRVHDVRLGSDHQ